MSFVICPKCGEMELIVNLSGNGIGGPGQYQCLTCGETWSEEGSEDAPQLS